LVDKHLNSTARNGTPIQDFETGLFGDWKEDFFGRDVSRNIVSSKRLNNMGYIVTLFDGIHQLCSRRKLFSRTLKKLQWYAFCAAKRPACSPKFTEGNVIVQHFRKQSTDERS
jgi:hypothetical protein